MCIGKYSASYLLQIKSKSVGVCVCYLLCIRSADPHQPIMKIYTQNGPAALRSTTMTKKQENIFWDLNLLTPFSSPLESNNDVSTNTSTREYKIAQALLQNAVDRT